MKQNNHFKNLSFLVMGVFFLLSAVILIAAEFFSAEVFRSVFIVFASSLLLFLLLLLAGFMAVNKILKEDVEYKAKPENKAGFADSFHVRLALRLFMPFLLFVSSIFNYRKEEIRRIYIKANNKYVLSLGKKFSPDKLLVILPHCLQWSNCTRRIREGLNECCQCARCNLGRIKDLVKKSGIMVSLATGGTSARQFIKELKPEIVIAVACERDLSSGIMDVSGLPVYGILNRRPNGPCKDTLVDTDEIERVIKLFTKEVN